MQNRFKGSRARAGYRGLVHGRGFSRAEMGTEIREEGMEFREEEQVVLIGTGAVSI